MLLIHESQRFRLIIETPAPVRLSARESYMKGWFAVRPVNSPGVLVAIVDGIPVPVVPGFSRTDVSKNEEDPKLRRSGFVVRFHTPRWDRNIRFVWQEGGDAIELTRLKIDFEDRVDGECRPRQARPHQTRPHQTRPHQTSDYERWLAHCEPRLFWPEDEIFDRLCVLPQLPLISVILPTYNTPPYFLNCCIRSVRAQRYANWELCVSDDGSANKDVLTFLENAALEDPRIKLTAGAPHGGISRASNRALERAQGGFIVLLDHDDELHPHALLEVVRYLNQVEQCDLIYSDEDKIDLYGHRSKPTFKPDFDRDIFLTFNYLGHLIALRTSVARAIGGFRSSCDGAQDWDLLMRSTEMIGPRAIHHLAKPLYHWRMHEESTSVNLLSKPYVRKAWVRVLSDYLKRANEEAEIEQGTFFGSMRLRRPVPLETRVAVFVRAEDGDYQIKELQKNIGLRRVAIYRVSGNAIRWAADGEDQRSLGEINAGVFVFINRPLETLSHGFLDELVGQALRSDCGIVTGLSLDSAGKAIHTGLLCSEAGELFDPYNGSSLSDVSYMRQLGVPRAVEAISDEFFAVRRNQLEAAGGVSSISSSGMPRLLRKLIQSAHRSGLTVLVTPYAIATFETAATSGRAGPVRIPDDSRVCLNANLAAFEDFARVC